MKPIKVIDVELDRPIDTIEGSTGYGQVQALVRFHRVWLTVVFVSDFGAPVKTGKVL